LNLKLIEQKKSYNYYIYTANFQVLLIQKCKSFFDRKFFGESDPNNRSKCIKTKIFNK